jgi:hypothetical protein
MTKKIDESTESTPEATEVPAPADEPKAAPIKGLTEGRMTHYVLESGTHRPAIIVHVDDAGMGDVQLLVFVIQSDGYGDRQLERRAVYDEEKQPGTWHFIEAA